MSQSAVIPEQVCLQQPFELPEIVTLSYLRRLWVLQAWTNGGETTTAKSVVWLSNNTLPSVTACQSSKVGACWSATDTSVNCQIDTGRPGQRPWTGLVVAWTTKCSWHRISVMWSRRSAPVASHAAAFWTDCTRRSSPSVTPYSSALQQSSWLDTKAWTSVLAALVDSDHAAGRSCHNR